MNRTAVSNFDFLDWSITAISFRLLYLCDNILREVGHMSVLLRFLYNYTIGINLVIVSRGD